ncbi:MAG: AAA family ATPase [Chloroflexota bacterium]|nr:AAA family ATPase [Chloroflexota bacterium]
MTELAYERVLEALRDRVPSVKANDRQGLANCPAHEDQHPSLGVTRIEGSVLLNCRSQQCHIDDILTGIGLTSRDLYDDRDGATYRYDDGRTVHRTPDKQFRQSGNTADRPILYHLTSVTTAVAAGEPVYVVEGEKDVHALESLGVTATTTPQGGMHAAKADWTPLHGAHVVLIPDRDQVGKQYAGAVADLLNGKAASLVVRLAKTGKDAADHIAAGHGLDELVPAELPKAPRRPWQPVDLTLVLSGTWKPPVPTVGKRADGRGLYYPGRAHTVISETEGGKTWLALSVALDELAEGHHVVYVDFEDDEGGVVGRLLTLGADPLRIRTYFHYLRPDEPLGGGINRDDLDAILGDCKPTYGVIDGITEAMSVHGLNPLDNADAAVFGRMLPRRITAAGAACASLDHVTKDKEGRGRYALGAVHKLNALDGAAYILDNRTPFGVGLTGKSTLKIAKDRPGQLRKHGYPSSNNQTWYGDLVLTSHGETFADVGIEIPHEADPDFRPRHLMSKIAKVLEQHESLSARKIEAVTGGNAASLRKALTFLQLDGYVSDDSPHRLLKPYDQDN